MKTKLLVCFLLFSIAAEAQSVQSGDTSAFREIVIPTGTVVYWQLQEQVMYNDTVGKKIAITVRENVIINEWS